MSTIEDLSSNHYILRPIAKETLSSKYEKCRNITEEIYKRINITFQIKKLENGSQSDGSHQSDTIDLNELSNETDLFAYDKSDSISSSISDLDAAQGRNTRNYINNNNNEELKIKKSVTPIYKRPRKRFRKRVKKRKSRANEATDSEASSDEAVPLSRIIDPDPVKRIKDLEVDDSKSESPDNIMGVPKITILTSHFGGQKRCYIKDEKQRGIQQKQTNALERDSHIIKIGATVPISASASETDSKLLTTALSLNKCVMCHFTSRSERGLRRHLDKNHSITESDSIALKCNSDVQIQ